MSKKIFVVSQIPDLAKLLKNEIAKFLTNDSKNYLKNVDIVNVKLAQKGILFHLIFYNIKIIKIFKITIGQIK